MKLIRSAALACLMLASAAAALAADAFPSRTVRIVVTSAPGGALDVTTRLVAQRMSESLGQPVIVDNHVGAGGLLAIREVKAARADGYTLLAAVNTVAIQQAVHPSPGYDLMKDLTGIGPMTRSPFLLLVSPDQPDKNLADLQARARARSGQLTYGSAGVGSTTQFAAAKFAQRAGIELLHIPYKGNSAAWPDLIAGRIDMLFEAYSSGASMIRAGKLKALAVTSTTRAAALPAVPTLIEQGVNDSFYLWIGLLAPAGTPKDVVQRLSDALRAALARPELSDRFRAEGAEPMPMSPEDFNTFLENEAAEVRKLVTELGPPKE